MKRIKTLAKKKMNEINAEDIKNGAKTLAKEASETGVEVVKTGVSSIINGIIMKVLLAVLAVTLIVGGGCVATNVVSDKVTHS